MPIQRNKDSHGPYYRWGDTGHKYYYTANNERSRERAKALAARQGRAIEWRRHRY